jgi:hypothetical protein
MYDWTKDDVRTKVTTRPVSQCAGVTLVVTGRIGPVVVEKMVRERFTSVVTELVLVVTPVRAAVEVEAPGKE